MRRFDSGKLWCEVSEADDADENADVTDTVDAALDDDDVERDDDDDDEVDDSIEGRTAESYTSLLHIAIRAAIESEPGREDDMANGPEDQGRVEDTGFATGAETSSASVTGVARDGELGAASRRALLFASGEGFDWLRALAFAAASPRLRVLLVLLAVGEAGTGEPCECDGDGDAGAEDGRDGRGETGEVGERQVGARVSAAAFSFSSSPTERLRPRYGEIEVPV